MISNYFKVAIRNLFKTRLYSFINILGLTIGITACLLILSYVSFEHSYDKFHDDHEQIYRLRYERTSLTDESARFASCCPPAGLRIRTMYPEVETVARIFRYIASVSQDGDFVQENKFIEERMFFAESEFFEIFKFKFIVGDPIKGIRESNTAFISATTAKKYFGDENPIGKIISVDKKLDFKITGLFEDIPENSHLKFDIILSFPNLYDIYGDRMKNSWGDTGVYTYLRFKENTDLNAFKEKLAELVENEFGEALAYYKLTMELPLQPLADIHLTSNYMQEYEVSGNNETVNFLTIIAIFIMIIAWVNYINLSTARSLTRAKEVGLRKVVGATKKDLAWQFFIETTIINLVAISLSLMFMEFLQPLFSEITGTSLEYSIWKLSWFWIALIILLFSGVFLSGFYPVIVMSSFKPTHVLKGRLGTSTRGISLREVLVVFQLLISLVLITATLTIFKQVSYMKNQDLGVSLENLVAIKAPRVRDNTFDSKVKTIGEAFLSNAHINKICFVTEVPGKQIYWDAGGIHRVGTDESKNYQIVGVDYDFADLFEVHFIAGRNFSREFKTDNMGLILNETAVRWMSFENPESAIAEKVDYWGEIYTIIGVIEDYHQQSLKNEFEPHLYRFMPTGRDVRGHFVIKLSSQNTSQTIAFIQQKYDDFFPGNPFEYFFIDEYFNRQYKSEIMFGTVFSIFSILAIFLTAMGILGLTSFIIEQRTREISIRSVLGSNMVQVLQMFVKNFAILILVSFIIAIPISYLLLNNWLDSFAYRMELHLWLFLIPLLFCSIIVLLTISILVYSTIRKNPIENLRYE